MSLAWPKTTVGWWRLCFAVAAAAFSLAISLQPPPWKVFAEAGDKMRVVDYVVAYTWIAAAINVVILAFLALICPWWARAPQPQPAQGVEPIGASPRWFWPAVLPAMLVCAVIAVPLLSQSLWDDEEASLRFAVLGHYKRDAETGKLFFREVRWRNTFFHYDTPNNHILHNALARVTNSIWRAIARPEGLQFTEWALRIPAFLAGMATLIVIALLLRDMGMPLAGVFASWFLALHPWFAKYCAEARAYSMVMLLVCLALLFWRRALIAGRWRDWGLFAACQALTLWTWPGALFFYVLLNLATVMVVLLKRKTAAPPRSVLSRWFCCNTLAAVALFPLMLPLFPQMGDYLKQLQKMDLTSKWFADTACYVATGAPWNKQDPGQLVHPEIRDPSTRNPWLYRGSLVMGLGLLGWGAVRFARNAPAGAVILFTVVAAPTLQIAQAMRGQFFLFEWYMVYLVPLITAVFAAGLAGFVRCVAGARGGKMIAPLCAAAVLVAFVVTTHPARAWRAAHSTVPFRESVLLTRPDLNPWSEENRQILTAGVTNPAFSYDGNLIWARSRKDLAILCRQADRQGRPLWLNLGHLWILEERQPDLLAMIEDRSLFTGHEKLFGEYPHCDRMVCRYIPGSMTPEAISKHVGAADIPEIEAASSESPEIYFTR